MANRTLAALVAVTLLASQGTTSTARADNQMGYRLLTADQANALPRNGGRLGIEVGRAEQISSSGLTFDILRVKGVAAGSAGAQAGFMPGDQIIAVDGRVFPSVASFAAYVGSMPPASQIAVDYMPPNGGPQNAQRITVTLGGARSTNAMPDTQAQSRGMSTGTKVAIGLGAAALFGCYKAGCFSRRAAPDRTMQAPR